MAAIQADALFDEWASAAGDATIGALLALHKQRRYLDLGPERRAVVVAAMEQLIALRRGDASARNDAERRAKLAAWAERAKAVLNRENCSPATARSLLSKFSGHDLELEPSLAARVRMLLDLVSPYGNEFIALRRIVRWNRPGFSATLAEHRRMADAISDSMEAIQHAQVLRDQAQRRRGAPDEREEHEPREWAAFAVPYARRATALQPQRPETWANLASCLRHAERLEEARDASERSIQLESDPCKNRHGHVAHLAVLRALDDRQLAVRLATNLIELLPDDPFALRTGAAVFFDDGQSRRAKELLEQWLKLRPPAATDVQAQLALLGVQREEAARLRESSRIQRFLDLVDGPT